MTGLESKKNVHFNTSVDANSTRAPELYFMKADLQNTNEM